jgi:PAS domain S-box-containing protein
MARASNAAKPVRVLVGTDDQGFADLVTSRMGKLCSPVVEVVCVDGIAGVLQHLGGAARWDALLLELHLADGFGLEALKAIVSLGAPPAVFVALRPGEEEIEKPVLEAGAHDCLRRAECDERGLARLARYALQRRRLQDELRERREFSRLISQNVTDLIMVLDKEGRRVYHSPSYKAILENPDLLKGSTAFLEIHPEDRSEVQVALNGVIKTGVGRRLEYRLLLRDSTVRFIESQANAIRDRWGKTTKAVVVSRDISERKHVEHALRQSEERYRHLLNSTTDYIFTVQLENGRSTGTKHGPGCEALTGYTPDDFEQNSHLWIGMVPEEDRPAVLAQVERLMRGETPPPIEHRLIRKDQRLRWIRNTSVPRRNAAGELVAYEGLISDITDRKLAEMELKRAYTELARNDEALRKTLQDLHVSHETLKATQLQLIQAEKFESIGTLAAGVAHEVKNPLQTILMGLAYLDRTAPSQDENIGMVLTDMRDAVKRADTIVRELLTLSAAAQITMGNEDFDAVVEKSLWLVNYEVNAARIRVQRDLAKNLPPVLMDRTRIEQVFLNLFLNAIQAMPQGGALTVRTHKMVWTEAEGRGEMAGGQISPGDTVVVAEVRDTGVGIPEQNLRRGFDPFFTTKPVGSGTGLGLAVARQIIDMHGGLLNLRNAEGGGVLATVVLKAQNPPRE